MTRSPHLPRCLCLAVALVLMPWSVSAQEILKDADGMVTVRASATPLGRLLRAVGDVVPFQKLVLDPKIEGRPVTVLLESVSLARALVTILGEAMVDYVLASDEEGQSVRLVAGDRTFIAAASQRAAGDRPTVAAASERVQNRVQNDDAFSNPKGKGDTGDAVDAPVNSVSLAGESGQHADTAGNAARAQDLERLLTIPRLNTGPGAIIELPFPNENGVPIIAVMPPKGVGPALALPGISVPAQPQPITAPGPKPSNTFVPVVVDPQVQSLIEALSPKPGAAK